MNANVGELGTSLVDGAARADGSAEPARPWHAPAPALAADHASAGSARGELLAATARAAFRRRLARLEQRLQSCRDVTPSECRHALATTLADDAACREASLTRELSLAVRGDPQAEAVLRPVLDAGCREWKAVVANALDGTTDGPKAALLADLLGYVSAGVTNKLGPAERAAEFDRLVTFLLDAAAR